jgi:hypothetical protein
MMNLRGRKVTARKAMIRINEKYLVMRGSSHLTRFLDFSKKSQVMSIALSVTDELFLKSLNF